MRRGLTVFLVALLALIFFSTAEGAVFTVASPAEFQDALTTAQGNGANDTINVAHGTYAITSTLTYATDDGDGTLTIQAQDPNNPPVLDGGGGVQIMNINNDLGNNGGDDGADVTIREIVFQHGAFPADDGAGGLTLITVEAKTVIEDCTIRNNTGGGMYVYSNSGGVTLNNNDFSSNTTNKSGGGLWLWSYSNTVSITNNTFSENSTDSHNDAPAGFANGDGGAIFANPYSGTLIIANNTFSGNSTSFIGATGGSVGGNGGAINVNSVGTSTAAFIITNNIFNGNHAMEYNGEPVRGQGGAIFAGYIAGPLVITNNIIWQNRAGGWYGGGIYAVMLSDSTLSITNNTIWQNSTDMSGGGIYAEITGTCPTRIYNNIIWYNTAHGPGGFNYCINALFATSMPEVFNNNVEAISLTRLIYPTLQPYPHGGNISDDPLLVDPANGDFHLQGTSPCIDTGNNNAPSLPSTDYEGDQRIMDGDGNSSQVVDMGADEYRSAAIAGQPATSVPTMNEWGLIIFSLLMAGFAIWFIKRRNHGSC